MSTELVTRTTTHGELSPLGSTLSVSDIVEQTKLIQEVMEAVMKPDTHYGVIPGTSGKPTLLKPGAEKLVVLFRLAPTYDIKTREDGQHREYEITCTLTHIGTQQVWGQGLGSCSTLEKKYAWRQAERTCPQCEKEGSIIKGRPEYGGGWVCWKKKGGCGANFPKDDPAIQSQDVDRVVNPDLPDIYNTVLKMAKKRALIDAVLSCTAASDCFTQDLEDLKGYEPEVFHVEHADEKPAQRPQSPPEPPASQKPGKGARTAEGVTEQLKASIAKKQKEAKQAKRRAMPDIPDEHLELTDRLLTVMAEHWPSWKIRTMDDAYDMVMQKAAQEQEQITPAYIAELIKRAVNSAQIGAKSGKSS